MHLSLKPLPPLFLGEEAGRLRADSKAAGTLKRADRPALRAEVAAADAAARLEAAMRPRPLKGRKLEKVALEARKGAAGSRVGSLHASGVLLEMGSSDGGERSHLLLHRGTCWAGGEDVKKL